MPQVKVKTSSGTVFFNYTISTPSSDNAGSIDPSLPTVLFLHPVYVSHVAFHPQFSSPLLRRFNLVGMDMRSHGETKGPVPTTFRRADAGEDVFEFMKALSLPPCHLFGLSLGACIALQTAISHPDKVLSLFMLSPLPLIEPEEVAAGRQEIYDCWADGLQNPDHHDAILDSVFGSVQLGFNGERSGLVTPLVQYIVPHLAKRSSPEELDGIHTMTVKIFVDRKPHPPRVVQNVKCPIHLVHCGGDIAYGLNFVEELRDHLQTANLDVQISQIAGAPHFGSVTHPEPINRLFHDWVLEKVGKPVPPAKVSVSSPFASIFKNVSGSESDSEDDFLF